MDCVNRWHTLSLKDFFARKDSLGFPGKYSYTLHEKCPHSEFFWSIFCHIRTEYGEIRNNKVSCSDKKKFTESCLIKLQATKLHFSRKKGLSLRLILKFLRYCAEQLYCRAIVNSYFYRDLINHFVKSYRILFCIFVYSVEREDLRAATSKFPHLCRNAKNKEHRKVYVSSYFTSVLQNDHFLLSR